MDTNLTVPNQTDISLDLIEFRISELEEKLLGYENSRSGRFDGSLLIDHILDVSDSLKAITAGREKFNTVHRKLTELDWLISNPDKVEEFLGDDTSKAGEILVRENKIKHQLDAFKQIQDLMPKLNDSHPFIRANELLPELKKIQQLSMQQSVQADAISQETSDLLSRYNSFIHVMKILLADWDNKLTFLEVESSSRKAEE